MKDLSIFVGNLFMGLAEAMMFSLALYQMIFKEEFILGSVLIMIFIVMIYIQSSQEEELLRNSKHKRGSA